MLENLRTAIREKFIEQKIAAKALEMNAGNLTKLTNTPLDRVDRLRPATISKLERVFSEYNVDWLIGKSPIKYKEDAENSHNKMPELLNKLGISVNNGAGVGQIPDDEMAMFDEDGNTKFYEISPGVYRMKVPLISEGAKAGRLCGFSDAEYYEDQDFIFTTVYRYHKGRYEAFKVIGDSMDVDRRITFVHGDIIIGREIRRELWADRFHTHKYPFFVFITKSDGIIFKEIVDHNVSDGIVTLRSLNEDKESYPDFEISLNEIAYIFNIVKREVEI